MKYCFPSSPVEPTLHASPYLDPTLAQTSLMSVASPCAAKKRIRKPENQVHTSSGVPWRYELIWFWNVPWSTVLTLTVIQVWLVNLSTASCSAFLGTASE